MLSLNGQRYNCRKFNLTPEVKTKDLKITEYIWMLSTFAFSFLQFRLVGKTALKLLLVFVEYTESNSKVLYDAVQTVDSNQGGKPK